MPKKSASQNKKTDSTEENATPENENADNTFDEFTKKYFDSDIKESRQRQLRSVIYSQILHEFRLNVQNQFKQKHNLKGEFYDSAIGILKSAFHLFVFTILIVPICLCICYCSNPRHFSDIMVSGIVSIVATGVSAVVAFIKIPKIIAKYLFNKDEDEYMASIVKQIQDYDNNTFQNEINKSVSMSQAKKAGHTDDEIENIPTDNNDLDDATKSETPYIGSDDDKGDETPPDKGDDPPDTPNP